MELASRPKTNVNNPTEVPAGILQKLQRPEPEAVKALSRTLAEKYQILPLCLKEKTLLVAAKDDLDSNSINNLQVLLSRPVHVATLLTRDEDIDLLIARIYDSVEIAQPSSDLRSVLASLEFEHQDWVQREDTSWKSVEDLANEAPIIRLVNAIILNAYEKRASDIHFDPQEEHLILRYRIDGILHVQSSLTRTLGLAVISRLKLLANLNIAERRLPQDGRIRYQTQGIVLDIRLATAPALHGEALVLRLFNAKSTIRRLSEIGMPAWVYDHFLKLLTLTTGIVLVTGPTGSGKTTTLYGALLELVGPERKILTLEDPVEYQIPGVTQIPIRPAVGLTFADGLRSLLRHDPDVIMVGEIRDRETAEIAIHAALTGHLVLATIHTNDACATLTRLVDMGIEPFLVSATVRGVLSQRLVRLVCSSCRTNAATQDPIRVQREVCSRCGGTGYFGRTGIFELLIVDEWIQREVLKQGSEFDIRAKALDRGFRPVVDDGESKVRNGMTTHDEIRRVLGDTWSGKGGR